MTPYGYQPQQPPPPPIVGTCLRCSQVIYQGQPFVAYQAGPVHPQCAQTAAVPQRSSAPPAWAIGLAVVCVLGMVGLMCVSNLAERDNAPPSMSSPSDEVGIGQEAVLYRRDDPAWRPPLCPDLDGYEAYVDVRGNEDKARAALQAHRCFTVAPNTRVTILNVNPTRVRVLDGSQKDRVAYIYDLFVHRP